MTASILLFLTQASFVVMVNSFMYSSFLSFKNKLVKGPGLQRQNYYPTPPTSVLPNTPDRSGLMAVSPRTANALYNVHRDFWQTHYHQQFTGNGPQNILKLDNFDEICREEDDSMVSDSNRFVIQFRVTTYKSKNIHIGDTKSVQGKS